MALFKIEKGLKNKLSVNRPNAVEGYCYFTTDDGKFYIDIADGTADVGTNRICLNAEKATTLETKRNINGVQFDGSADVNNYAECTTAAATGAKQITIPNFILGKGSRVIVKFINANTASSPTLEVSSDGSFGKNAKPIKVYGNTAMGIGNTTDSWSAGAIVPFTYDGTNWVRDYWYNTIQDIPEQKKYIPIANYDGNGNLLITSDEFPLLETTDDDYCFNFIFFLEETADIAESTLVKLEVGGQNTYTLGALYIDYSNPSIYNRSLKPGLYYAYCHYQTAVWISFNHSEIPWHVDNSSWANKAYSLETGGNKVGSETQPVYFDAAGYPQVCTGFDGLDGYLPLTAGEDKKIQGELGLTSGKNYGDSLPSTGFTGEIFFVKDEQERGVLFRGETIATSALSSISIPTEITQNIDSSYLLQVYQNGVLLSAPENYSIASDNASITLNGYSCQANDIFTFVMISDTIQGLDSTVYATKEYLDNKLANFDFSSSDYVAKAGDTMTGALTAPSITVSNTTNATSATTGALQVKGGIGVSNSIYAGGAITTASSITATGNITGSKVYGAVWNDYAEYRISDCLEAGRVVCENGDDTLSISNKRLQPGANIISDTFGFAIGETEDAKCPIAVSGRVLAYTYEPRDEFKPGKAVCAGPNGTVSRMTRKEIKEYPERIIGTVSAIPSYEYWGENNVPVNGRIWIKVK